MKKLLWLSFFLCLPILSHATSSLIWEVKQIPMQTKSGPITLEALLVTPKDQQQHPTVLINHGSPRDAKGRSQMSAKYYLPIAEEFAKRGYAVAVVLRRGYGSSGGGWAEGYGGCAHPDYLQAAQASAQDLHAIIDYLSQNSSFNVNNILAVGHSAGGFATLALSAFNPPKGLKAAIVFAPGRGSYGPNKVCVASQLIAAFSQLGKTSRIPILWVSAENDHYFNPELAQQLFSAFTDSGGNARFLLAPAFGQEGHYLFTNAGIPQWLPFVDTFIASH